MYYAIQVVGYGKRRRYGIVQVIGSGFNPTTGRSYSSEDEARRVAASLGYEIKACGDNYSIINL